MLQKNNFTPDNDPKNRQFFYLDHEELADAMGVTSVDLPVIVDALGKSPQNGLRQNLFLYSLSATNSCTFCVTAVEGASGETTLDNPLRKSIASYLEFYMTPEKHAGYAATWYAELWSSVSALTRLTHSIGNSTGSVAASQLWSWEFFVSRREVPELSVLRDSSTVEQVKLTATSVPIDIRLQLAKK